MKYFAERTCTVVRERHEEQGRQSESSPSHEAESRPLESFREEPAYVLLGSPGSGKTKAFEREAQQEGGHYVTAGDFRELDAKPEWRDRTLYIDGLDETRAGAFQGRTPFGAIRVKLQRLGNPRFRLSCREADWFGAYDRERLTAVAPNGKLLVLRLDPLSDQGILDILRRNLGRQDPKGFVAVARQRGVDGLLRNPLNLKMLSAAVRNNAWPRTRTRTFALACRKLVSEENPEHQIAVRGTANATALLDAAGDLCATLLLTGTAGVTLPGTLPDTHHPPLEHVHQGNQQLLRRVVGTNLFALSAEGRLIPAHRQLAEFLAARRLAELVAKGLPVCRLFALMTGFDGGIISEFRGLAAWLAAHSKPARDALIERDSLGVVLYGDVEDFSAREKTLVLKTLREETERNPWLVGYTTLDSPLGRLVDPGLEHAFSRALADPARDEAHQSFVFMILDAIRSGPAVPGVAEPLMAIVRDDSWPMMHRCAALEAYVRVRRGDPRVAATLQSLLDELHTGVVPTHDDDLLGTLLDELYPDDLSAADLVRYLREPVPRNKWTSYGTFWTSHLIEQSNVPQMVQLLDLLREPMEKVRGESGVAPRNVGLVIRPPIVLLRHLLERSPESVPQELLLYWLDFAGWLGQRLRSGSTDAVGDTEFFRNWLSDRPDVQKAIVAQTVSRCLREEGDLRVRSWHVRRSLFGATPPRDYGAWCADQALSASNDEIADWFVVEAAAFAHKEQDSETRRREEIARKLRRDGRLAEAFEGKLAAWNEENRSDWGLPGTPQAQATPDRGRFNDLRDWVRSNLVALRGNECRPDVLHTLAVAFLDGFSDVHGETPLERLHHLLGPDDDLVDAALAGLRGAIHRSDLPTWTGVHKLAAKGRIHYLARPFMVGLEELSRIMETSAIQLSEPQARLALAIHFAVPRLRSLDESERPPRWLQMCIAREPDMVAEVWARCAGAQLRSGEKSLSDAHRLARQPQYAQLARIASVPLLKAFPVRCGAGQLPILRSLLQAAASHADKTRFLDLIEAKLTYKSMNAGQRVYWLTAGLFMRPETNGDRLESYVSGRGRRIKRLVEMIGAVPRTIVGLWDATILERLMRLIGPYSAPPPDTGEVYSVTWPIQANRYVHGLIDRLSEDASDAARDALASLAADDRLFDWRSKLLDGYHRQKSAYREATFVHPGLEDVAEVLANGRPAGVADLWALATDILEQLARYIRDGATSDWCQYWNVDKYNRAETPIPENGCRDRLLSDLDRELAPLGVEASKEGSYADDKRSDIRLSVPRHPGYNVPIEIKRSCHRDWWSSIKTQLINQYTRDPGADGYGVYLVFWFGKAEGCRPKPASGRTPKSPEQLRQALIENLTLSERRKISVCIIDVSKPENQKKPDD